MIWTGGWISSFQYFFSPIKWNDLALIKKKKTTNKQQCITGISILLLKTDKKAKKQSLRKMIFSWGIPEGKNFLTVSKSRKQPNGQQETQHILILVEQLRDKVECQYYCFCITGQKRIHSFYWRREDWNFKLCIVGYPCQIHQIQEFNSGQILKQQKCIVTMLCRC